MPLYLIAGIALLVLLLAAGKAFVALPPAIIVRFLIWLGVFAAIALSGEAGMKSVSTISA